MFLLCFAGLLGPTIRGQEGETIVVMFKNMADLHYSLHAHGIAYGKQSEGGYKPMMSSVLIGLSELIGSYF